MIKRWRHEFGWYLYDFGNSFAAVLGGVYFGKWFIEDLNNTPLLFNMLLTGSGVIVILSAWAAGRQIDRGGLHIWFWGTTICASFSLLSLSVVSRLPLDVSVLTVIAASTFGLFGVAYQLSRICHNVFLRRMINSARREAVSGLGATSNWMGSVFGILASVPLVAAFPGVEGREFVFLLAFIGYSLLSFVALRLMGVIKATKAPRIERVIQKTPWIWFLSFWSLAVFLLYDAMSTVQRNLPPFLSEVFRMPDDTQALVFLVILLSAASGGLFAARYVRTINSLQWIVFPSFGLAAAIFILSASVELFSWLAYPIAGFAYGLLESSIRVSLMAKMSEEDAGIKFAFLASLERAAGVAGPLLWATPFAIFSDTNDAYKGSMALMGLAVVIGAIVMMLERTKSR